MQSKFLILGFVLIFSGVVVTSLYNALIENYVFQQGYTKTREFQVSGYFDKGDKLVLSIVPGNDWVQYIDWLETFYVPDYLDVTIRVQINNTEGQSTVLDLIFITYASSTGEYAQLSLFAAYPNFTSGGLTNLEAAGSEGAVRGIVETNGTYTATAFGKPDEPIILVALGIPPTSITLDKYVTKGSYPYRHIWPAGVALIGSGGFSFFWARRQTQKRKLLRKKKMD
jgi:hypothetical protein